jgi:hypothetical protein
MSSGGWPETKAFNAGTLRAAFIVSNIAQARVDAATGNVSGVIAWRASSLAGRAFP